MEDMKCSTCALYTEGECTLWAISRDDTDGCDNWVSKDPPTLREYWESMDSDILAEELRKGGFCVQRYNNPNGLCSLSKCVGNCVSCIADLLNTIKEG